MAVHERASMPNAALLADPSIIPDPYPVYALLAEASPVHWCEELKAGR
jgi:hypothetical protein